MSMSPVIRCFPRVLHPPTMKPQWYMQAAFILKIEVLENNNYKPTSNEDIYTIAIQLREELDSVLFEKNKMLNDFVDHLENHVIEKGYMPNIDYCRNKILPLFSG